MQKSLLNLSYVQMFASWRSWMHLRAIGRQFTQMNANFLVMNSKMCKRGHQSGNFLPHMSSFLHFEVYPLNLPFFTIRPCHSHCKLSKNGPFRRVSKSRRFSKSSFCKFGRMNRTYECDDYYVLICTSTNNMKDKTTSKITVVIVGQVWVLLK